MRGSRKTFKIKLCPERSQKKAWGLMTEQAQAVTIVANTSLEGWERTLEGGVIARDFFLTDRIKEEARSIAPDLLPMTVEGLLDRAWSAFSARVDREALCRNRGISSPEFDLPTDQVIFSVSEMVVRIPYLGLIRYTRNKFIQAKDLTQVSENVQWLQQNIRRMWLGNQASDFFLLLDCTDAAEDQKRKEAKAKRLRNRKKRKAEKTMSKWLGVPTAKDSDG